MGWDEAKQRTVVQRYKESADEYRYFPEPDLPILEISREWVERGARLTCPNCRTPSATASSASA